MSGGQLPPSPPWTESSTLGQQPPNPSSVTSQTAPDSPPTSPKQQRNPQPTTAPSLSPTPPATTLASPLAPLPSEAFFNVVSFLPQSARPRLCLVSRSWHNFLANEPRLWPELRVDLHHDQREHVELWAARAGVGQDGRGAGVRVLRLTLACQQTYRERYGDIVVPAVMGQRMVRVFKLLDQGVAAGRNGRGLDRLEVLSTPSTYATINLLTGIASYANAPCARNLKSVKINGWLSEVWIHQHMLSLWPELEQLDLTFYDGSKYEGIQPAPQQWDFGTPQRPYRPLLSLDKLRSIAWHSLIVPLALDLPTLPALTSLTLNNVVWEGYSLLLLVKLARCSLERISIANLLIRNSDPTAVRDDYDRCVLEDDDESVSSDELDEEDGLWARIAPVLLPNLRQLTLVGLTTPPLFGSLENVELDGDEVGFSTGVWHMPNLEECTLRCVDLDSTDMLDQSLAPLRLLGQNTTKLRSLDLTGSTCTPRDIHCALLPSGTSIASLSLAHTIASDQLLAHLPALTPRLAELDVRQCGKISITAVARLAEAIRDRSDGRYRLERVRADWPEWGHAEFAAAEWLMFHGIWVRDEEDFEGLGPMELGARRKWVREGKADAGKEEREQRWREREAEVREAREREEAVRVKAEWEKDVRMLRERGERRGREGTSEVHYRVGRSETGRVVLLEPYEPGTDRDGQGDGMEVEGTSGAAVEDGSDKTLRSPSSSLDEKPARVVNEPRAPLDQELPSMAVRPASAMSVVERAG